MTGVRKRTMMHSSCIKNNPLCLFKDKMDPAFCNKRKTASLFSFDGIDGGDLKSADFSTGILRVQRAEKLTFKQRKPDLIL